MASPIALGWYPVIQIGEVKEWVIGLYSIYEDKKGILRWRVEKIAQDTWYNHGEELCETFRMHALEKSDIPVITSIHGWANTLEWNGYIPKFSGYVPNEVKPNSACTKKQLYLLFPELEKSKMPFLVMKDYIKERL